LAGMLAAEEAAALSPRSSSESGPTGGPTGGQTAPQLSDTAQGTDSLASLPASHGSERNQHVSGYWCTVDTTVGDSKYNTLADSAWHEGGQVGGHSLSANSLAPSGAAARPQARMATPSGAAGQPFSETKGG
jgi:hypothetical protein